MDFGIFNLMNRRDRGQGVRDVVANTVAQVQAAETAGFGTAWFTEHHFTNYSMPPSPLMMVVHVAPQTRRIRLGTGVVLPALYQAPRLMGEIAFADAVCGGRLVLGLGSGYQAYELARFGVALDDARDITAEWVDFLTGGLGQESVEYRGTHIDLPQTWFTMPPVQTPRPPIWIAGNSPETYAMAAKYDLPVIATGFGQGTAMLRAVRDGAEEAWAKAGRDVDALRFSTLRYGFVSDDKAEALAFAESARYQVRLSRFLRKGQTTLEAPWLPEEAFEGEMTPEELLAWNPIGDAGTVAERLIDEIRTVGPEHIAMFMTMGNMDHTAVMRSIERFGRDVIPMIEKELGPLSALGRAARAAAE